MGEHRHFTHLSNRFFLTWGNENLILLMSAPLDVGCNFLLFVASHFPPTSHMKSEENLK